MILDVSPRQACNHKMQMKQDFFECLLSLPSSLEFRNLLQQRCRLLGTKTMASAHRLRPAAVNEKGCGCGLKLEGLFVCAAW